MSAIFLENFYAIAAIVYLVSVPFPFVPLEKRLLYL